MAGRHFRRARRNNARKPNYLFAQDALAKDTPKSPPLASPSPPPANGRLQPSRLQFRYFRPKVILTLSCSTKKRPMLPLLRLRLGPYKPGFARPVRTTQDIADRDGWTAGKQIIYETS